MATAQHNTDWMKSSQQYWDAWFEAQRNAFGRRAQQAGGAQGAWADFFKEWQNAVSGQDGRDLGAFRQCFARAGETYMSMLQQFYQGTGQSKPVGEIAKEWTEGLQNLFASAAQMYGQPFDVSKGRDFFSNMDPLGFFASLPGLGYTREKQEDLNRLYKEWVAYERKSREYNAAMAKVGQEAVRQFQEYLANPPKEAEPLTSLKSIYAKWVDVCEGIYAKYAMTEEYTELYGEVVNALMTFRKRQNKMIDDMADQFNLPTRQEVDSLHKQVHALKRELAALRAGKAPKAEKPAPAAKKAKGRKA